LQAGVNVDSDVRFSRFFCYKVVPNVVSASSLPSYFDLCIGENSFSAFISLPFPHSQSIPQIKPNLAAVNITPYPSLAPQKKTN